MPEPIRLPLGEDGEEVELPSMWEICGECRGEGHHAHHIDGNGLTSSDLEDWDEEEFETYMRGGYDKTCSECKGTGKVLVVDLDRLTPEQAKLYDEWMEDERQYRAIQRMERDMGA